jgi:transposase InsO family protein
MKTQTAKEVAKHVFNLVCRHSCPKRILTDQGKCFEAELFQELLALLDIAKSRTTPYHPQADGLTERFNRTLEGMLRCFIQENLSDWDEYLDPLAFAYNTAVHATTRDRLMTPSADLPRDERRLVRLVASVVAWAATWPQTSLWSSQGTVLGSM